MLHVSEPVDGGVGRCVAFLAQDQVRRGWRVAVASPEGVAAPLGESLADDVRAAGATHLRWQARTPPGPWTAAEVLHLSRLVRRFDPNVVHLHSSAAGLAGRLAVRGRVATVFQPNAWSFLAADGATRRVAVAWERYGARWCSALLCVSSEERSLGERIGIDGPYRVIPNGVDVDAVGVASATDRAEARSRLKVLEGPLVVCIGRLSRQKGQDVLLEAWPRVVAAAPRAQLALVGDGPDRDSLLNQSPADVLFPGAVDNVRDWLAAADVVAIPSRWEGMSFTMLDAMATGRCVVSAAVPGAGDALEPAALVRPVDAPALAAAISQRLDDPSMRAREERTNRARAERCFDVRLTCDRTADLYKELSR